MEAAVERNEGLTKQTADMEHTLLLLDRYDADAEKLYHSFKAAGCCPQTMVIEPDGFLPEDVLCPYTFLLGDFAAAPESKGGPLYFNEVETPDYWQIKGNASKGTVYDLTQKRAQIYFLAKDNKRLVKTVEWLDAAGVVRSVEQYNQYGMMYARTICDIKGKPVNTTYFSAEGKEVLHENLITHSMILTKREQEREITYMFPDKVSFVCFVLKSLGLDDCAILYNSLSTPFSVTLYLSGRSRRDMLFWQEGPRKDIPGNMQIILQNTGGSTDCILVQQRESYEKLLTAGADPAMLRMMGYTYTFEKENHYTNNALICTNSDQIEQLDQLVRELPEMHFHIAALTEMSAQLMAKEVYPNVTLYPTADRKTIIELFSVCDWYFDINHEAEIVSAVQQAFMHNELIFAFSETQHNKTYICPEHICSGENRQLMVLAVKTLLGNEDAMEAELARQRKYALSEDSRTYAALLGKAAKMQ